MTELNWTEQSIHSTAKSMTRGYLHLNTVMFMMPTAGLRHFPGLPSGLLVGNLGFQCGYFLLPFLNLWERVISEGNCLFLHIASLSATRLSYGYCISIRKWLIHSVPCYWKSNVRIIRKHLNCAYFSCRNRWQEGDQHTSRSKFLLSCVKYMSNPIN